jgi:cytochrome c553
MAIQTSSTIGVRAALHGPTLCSVLFLSAAAILAPKIASAAAAERVDQLVRTTLELDANAERGAKLYAEHCARCHGEKALGNAAYVIPSLAGQRRAYVIKQFADFVELERDSRDMHNVLSRPAVANPQVWADVSLYLNGLPTARFPEAGDGSGVELGEAIFREQCASCHEEDARGDDDGFVPSLRDQHYSYLLREIRGLATSHRSNVDDDLIRFLDSLDTEEMTAVADYLARLRGPVRDRQRLRDDGTVSD